MVVHYSILDAIVHALRQIDSDDSFNLPEDGVSSWKRINLFAPWLEFRELIRTLRQPVLEEYKLYDAFGKKPMCSNAKVRIKLNCGSTL